MILEFLMAKQLEKHERLLSMKDEILEQFHLEKEKRNTDFKSILNEELFMNVYSIYFLNAFMKT